MRFPVVIIAALLISTLAVADDVEDVLALWGDQSGPWKGEIDIYGPGGSGPTTVDLVTRWDATHDRSIVTKIETFLAPERQTSAVTVMLAGPDDRMITTPYFVNGQQHDYRFAVESVAVTDATHWTTIIASPDGSEIYEDRPAVLRYVRTREGDRIENTKEVNFLDDDGDESFELRSLIRQTLKQ